MDFTWHDLVNGGGGLAALWLAFNIRRSVDALQRIVDDHDTRLKALEARRKRR